MTASGHLTQCLRMLLLPIRAGRESRCARALLLELRSLGITTADFRGWVELHTGLWRDAAIPSVDLNNVVIKILQQADSDSAVLFSDRYFTIHRRLMSEHLMSHEDARAFLSNAFLMSDLASLERLSAAQIAKLLSSRDERVLFSRQAVTLMLTSVGLAPDLPLTKVERLFQRDLSSELPTFADADLFTAGEIVDGAAATLGFPGQIVEWLSVLAPATNLALFTPYLQVLHYQCTIAEFYDHAVTDLYEFSPRGIAAGWLFNMYPATLAGAGNPFLNNMKSVGKIDDTWARSKKRAELPGANALLQVLKGLEAMGFSARRELAKLIRLWIHRVIRLSHPFAIPLPPVLTAPQVEQLLAAVAVGNTSSYGVIEQRVVDAIALARHQDARWRSRGLSDSVNATNISRCKIGDCDFQNSSAYQVVAYEAHGGTLTDVYVDEHLRTLKKVMAVRKEEFTGISDLPNWSVKIVFVAHQIDVTPRVPVDVDGVSVTVTFETFDEFIASISGPPPLTPDWNTWILAPLRENRTPLEVRRAFVALAGI